ncbi:SelT/selW/selH selenoprotein [Salinibacter sp. 10B]|uniref:SelT/SelW/SelH family protein n=1 Tax=Salinibacter sp. 10B TaxID=1923971 RepID=UPI000CF558C9|nr:SelT/SelW/SelH family protein [Salinibacter sp. 10B]PQJ33315.1 SelT/selW/selH selenoprotein [Salinibacter sp. 10B]
MTRTPRIEIRYCYQCRWTARAAWMAQEVLTTFTDTLGEVALVPVTGGTFEIRADGRLLWALAEKDRFPQPKELKQRVRDAIDPARDLGHADREE